MSAAVCNFSLSNSDTTELEEAVLSLSESIGHWTQWAACTGTACAGSHAFLHVQKVNYARSSTVYSRITLTPVQVPIIPETMPA